ncbi:MAG: RNA 2',3'-cyclic phosphodiesterase [Elusimicrobia bacterium]|nr:RNA 2',3'-cyclic phosphodiesterase [Elusimicrobiota bacterium]
MRLFIAVNIPEEIKEKLSVLTKRLKYKISDVRWIAKDNFHLTLKFLGEVREEKVDKINSAISDIAQNVQPFKVLFSELGAFPDLKYPRIIWVGVKEGSTELKGIAEKIENSLLPFGFEKEKRPFSCHLTVGRVKSFKTKNISFEKIDTDFGSFVLERIDLMQSFLEKSGPGYKCLKSFSFGG